MNKKNYYAALFLLVSTVAVASDADISTFGQLDTLRAKNAVLDAQVRNAELQKKLNELTGIAAPSSPAGQAAAFVAQTRSASVVSVSGTTAVVSLANGSSINVHPGTRIPGLGVVKQVSVREVTVADGKNLITLPFASDSVTSTTSPSMPVPGALMMPARSGFGVK